MALLQGHLNQTLCIDIHIKLPKIVKNTLRIIKNEDSNLKNTVNVKN